MLLFSKEIYDHITLLFKGLQWLPFSSNSNSEIFIMVCKAIDSLLQACISNFNMGFVTSVYFYIATTFGLLVAGTRLKL
jgi:hypothetical protein